MKSQKFLLVFAILFSFLQFSFGQEFMEDENWIGEIEGRTSPFLIQPLKWYTKEDVIKAKEKLNLIKQAPAGDEWEGAYSLFGELSDTKLFWNSEIGFINYYIYTCATELRGLNYGRAVNYPDSIILFTEKTAAPFPGMTETGQVRFIKVKWGDLHYLVKEDELELFCELAAGYYGAAKVETIEENGETYSSSTAIWDSFWVKSADARRKPVGLPVLPKAFVKFVKQPIESKIIAIGKYEKDQPSDVYATHSRRYVTIDAGKNKGIKENMEFYVSDLQERIKIVRVSAKTSVAVLERFLDSETNEESYCQNVSFEEIPCQSLKIGMKIKTVPDEFLEKD